jgi:phage terminase small subunit
MTMKDRPGAAMPAGVPADPEAWERALNSLAGGNSITEASRQSGYARSHLNRLLKKPEFVAELEKRKAEAPVSDADVELATETLRDMAENADRQSDRIAAAKALLDWSTRRKPKVTIAPVIKVESDPQKDEEEARKWRIGKSS